jgi:ferric-dicitrate binding protein FerR (iron transport regulator)
MKDFPGTLMYSVRRPIALSLAMAILNLSASFAFASTPGPAVALGTIKMSGAATVNDLPALSGETILSGSHIVTASKSNSILELGNFTRLILSEQTDFAVDFSATSISGSLRQGEVRAFIPVARTLSIITPDGAVATDSSEAVFLSVQVEAGVTRISVERGRVEWRSGGNTRVLASGETFAASDSLSVPPPQQNLSKTQRIGLIAGIGAGMAILLIAIIGQEPRETSHFGGCAIVPSGSNDGSGFCP